MTGANGENGRRSQRAILREHGIRPVKRRGQNFLTDGNLARAIASDVCALGDHVLELGAGGGALTGPLLDAGARVLAVEVDRHLCKVLEVEFGGRNGFCLREADLAELEWEEAVAAAGPRPVMAGNLPYVLTSTVLFALGRCHDRVSGGVFMVQKEVAQRLTAKPGGRDYGVLGALLGAVYDVRTARTVPATVFWPRPEVTSAVVVLTPREVWPADIYERYQRTVKALFGHRRKTLATCLRRIHDLAATDIEHVFAEADVDSGLRPEQLDSQALRRLALALPEDFGA